MWHAFMTINRLTDELQMKKCMGWLPLVLPYPSKILPGEFLVFSAQFG